MLCFNWRTQTRAFIYFLFLEKSPRARAIKNATIAIKTAAIAIKTII